MTAPKSLMRHSKGPLASWVTLRILIVLNWIFGALIFALLAISFQAEEWTWRALHVGALAGHESVATGMRAIMVIGIASTPIAWALFGLELLHICVVAIASAVSTKEVPLHISGDFDLTGWLAILLLFVLAQVFLEGTRIREDLEGTV